MRKITEPLPTWSAFQSNSKPTNSASDRHRADVLPLIAGVQKRIEAQTSDP